MRVFGALREAIRLAQRGRVFRICHFSVQGNHVHLLVEAKSRDALARGVQGLAIRMARAINRPLRRSGKVWGDRYHRRDLATPREVRSALVYVLNNFRKHGTAPRVIDPSSSARWFDGWRDVRAFPSTRIPTPIARAATWLLSAGWRRHGLLHSTEASTPPSHRAVFRITDRLLSSRDGERLYR
jgi:REP element-mobilizing transposase RayT